MASTQTIGKVQILGKAGRFHRAWPALRGLPLIPLAIMLVMLSCAVFGDFIIKALPTTGLVSSYDPEVGNLIEKHQPPFGINGGTVEHILGTDRLGRDVLSRLIRGTRVSMMVAFISIALSGLIGTTLGLLAGYHGGWLDVLVMRLVDLFLAFPAILLALVFAVTLGPNFWWVIVVLVLIRWAHFARLARGDTLSLKGRDFVNLARVAGVPTYRIIMVHIFPNIVNSVVVLGTLHVGSAIITEATLSFLGAGVPPPTPSWGEMIAGDRNFIRTAWWVSASAGTAIILAVLSFNLLGDWLRDRLDPGLRTL